MLTNNRILFNERGRIAQTSESDERRMSIGSVGRVGRAGRAGRAGGLVGRAALNMAVNPRESARWNINRLSAWLDSRRATISGIEESA